MDSFKKCFQLLFDNNFKLFTENEEFGNETIFESLYHNSNPLPICIKNDIIIYIRDEFDMEEYVYNSLRKMVNVNTFSDSKSNMRIIYMFLLYKLNTKDFMQFIICQCKTSPMKEENMKTHNMKVILDILFEPFVSEDDSPINSFIFDKDRLQKFQADMLHLLLHDLLPIFYDFIKSNQFSDMQIESEDRKKHNK